MHSYVCKWQLASCRDALKRWGVGGGGSCFTLYYVLLPVARAGVPLVSWCPNRFGLSDPLLITFNLLQMCRSVFYLSTYLHLINFLKTLLRPRCVLVDNSVKTQRMSAW